MLKNLFPNSFGGANPGAGKLASGAQFGIAGNDANNFSSAAQLPAKVSDQMVLDTANLRGQLEGQSVVLQRLSEEKLALADAALKNLEVRIKHSEQMMSKEDKFQKQVSKHTQNFVGMSMNHTANEAHLDGYTAQLQQSRVEIEM